MATGDLPIENPAQGVLVVRYEWPDQLEPQWQQAVVEAVGVQSAFGPVGLLFILAPRICVLAPNVRVFWRTVVRNPQLRIAALAVVTASWAVEVETQGFEITNALSGRDLRVATFRQEAAARAWVLQVVRPEHEARQPA